MVQRNGTFFEAGGHDGEFLSTTLTLEVKHGWTGVLVEPVPWLHDQLLKKNRRVVSVNACVSPKVTAHKVTTRTVVYVLLFLEETEKEEINNTYFLGILPPITYYWTVPLILDNSYLVGKLTSSKIADTKVSGF